MGLEKGPKIEFTVEELTEAVSQYELLTPAEVGMAYEAMLKVPQFGMKLAAALQFAAKMTTAGKMTPDRMLDAAVVPAFLVGMLVGSKQQPVVRTEPPSFDEQMAMLEQCVGKDIRVEYVSYGEVRIHDYTLERVDPYLLLKFLDESIPFIGSGVAIRRVSLALAGWHETVYLNPKIPRNYDIRADDNVERFRAEVWGPIPPLKKKA
jgi:hypothetical protein